VLASYIHDVDEKDVMEAYGQNLIPYFEDIVASGVLTRKGDKRALATFGIIAPNSGHELRIFSNFRGLVDQFIKLFDLFDTHFPGFSMCAAKAENPQAH
jgi:hypothetical protein